MSNIKKLDYLISLPAIVTPVLEGTYGVTAEEVSVGDAFEVLQRELAQNPDLIGDIAVELDDYGSTTIGVDFVDSKTQQLDTAFTFRILCAAMRN